SRVRRRVAADVGEPATPGGEVPGAVDETGRHRGARGPVRTGAADVPRTRRPCGHVRGRDARGGRGGTRTPARSGERRDVRWRCLESPGERERGSGAAPARGRGAGWTVRREATAQRT